MSHEYSDHEYSDEEEKFRKYVIDSQHYFYMEQKRDEMKKKQYT